MSGEFVTVVYGASDDLIEVEGTIREEFTANAAGERDLLAFSNGVVLDVRYDDDGCWRIVPLRRPDLVSIEPAGDPDSDNYSDRVTMQPGALWVVHGGAWATVQAEYPARREPVFDDEFGLCMDPCEHPSINGTTCAACGQEVLL